MTRLDISGGSLVVVGGAKWLWRLGRDRRLFSVGERGARAGRSEQMKRAIVRQNGAYRSLGCSGAIRGEEAMAAGSRCAT